MNCKHWEETIYLYDELAAEERRQVDEHLKQCVTCKQLFLERQHARQLVADVAAMKFELRNESQLTHGIMLATGAIQEREPWLTKVIDSFLTRYALGACSLVLVVFFLMEQQADFTQQDHAVNTAAVSKSDIILDSNSFLKATQAAIDRAGRISNPSLYSCVKNNQCDNAIVTYYKQKMYEKM
jgi:predicted anti-sigma-YlaC factor YlaD